jgi:hypothetical protein
MADDPSTTDAYSARFHRRVAVRLRSDTGPHTVVVPAQGRSPEDAASATLDMQHAPRRAVLWVRVEPVCGSCTRVASRRERGDSGEPLCETCATDQHAGVPGGKTAHTVPLSASRWEPVPFVP